MPAPKDVISVGLFCRFPEGCHAVTCTGRPDAVAVTVLRFMTTAAAVKGRGPSSLPCHVPVLGTHSRCSGGGATGVGEDESMVLPSA